MLKNKNFKLMLYILIVVIIFIGIGTILLNTFIFNKKDDEESYKSEDSISTPIVSNVGLPDGDISIESEIVQKLFNYFREDHNCMYNYVNNINGSSSSKLIIAYNYLIDKNGVNVSCSKYNTLVISSKYFCSDTIDINRDIYNLGINSSQFINYLKTINTFELDGNLVNNEMNNIFGIGVGYSRDDFLYSNDSYIHYDASNNKYVMYKYFNNNSVCKSYNEELVRAVSSNGSLEIRSKLMDGDNIVRNISRVFKFDSNTGQYIFQNRYVV